MDAAVLASTPNLIIGIRGNRLSQFNPADGSQVGTTTTISGSPFGRNGCLAYDSITNKIFAAVWNTPHFDVQNVGGFQESISNRTLYKINPSTLAVEQTFDITTTFNLVSGLGAPNNLAAMEAGFCAMDSAVSAGVGWIYCRWWACFLTGGLTGGSLRFNNTGNVLGGIVNGNEGVAGGYPNISYGLVGGDDNAIFPNQEGTQQVIMSDLTTVTDTPFGVAHRNILATGFAPVQQRVFVTDVAQVIYVYSSVGASLGTIDTLRSSFNGLAVRRNPTTGLIYVPGGSDNSVAVINPASGAFGALSGAVRLGFDCPIDIVCAGALTYAVQAGAIPIKLIT